MTVSVPERYRHLLEVGDEIRRVEGWTRSDLFIKALQMIVDEKQREINPQLQLNGSNVSFAEFSERKVIAGILQMRRHGFTFRDIAKIVPAGYSKTKIIEICKPLETFRGKRRSKESLNMMKERWRHWLLGLDEHLFEAQKREETDEEESCSRPVNPKCQTCPDRFDCVRYREAAP